jgi:flagellar basal body-associated protein FliL
MEQGQSKLSMPVVLGILAVVLALTVFMAMRFMPWSGNISPAKTTKADPNADFYKQMAQKCQGDMTKLSPQDQQEVMQRAGSPQYARQILINYYGGAKQ